MMLDHIEIVKAALHIFEVVEGKHPDVRLESYRSVPESKLWEVGFSRVEERPVFGNCEKRVQYLVTVKTEFPACQQKHQVMSVGKVEQCE